jgi:hypothetical protein
MSAAELAKDAPQDAVAFLEKGANAARVPETFTSLVMSKVLLELGVARWIAGAER